MDIGLATGILGTTNVNVVPGESISWIHIIGWLVTIAVVILNIYLTHRLKRDLSKEIINYEIKLKHLHERRIEAIAELYSKLVAADLRFKALTAPVKPSSTDEGECRDIQEYLATEAYNSLYEFRNHAEYAHIFFPKKIRKLLKKMISTLFKYMSKYQMAETYKSRDSETIHQLYQDVWNAVIGDIPVLKAAIEEEFRKHLGSDEDE